MCGKESFLSLDSLWGDTIHGRTYQHFHEASLSGDDPLYSKDHTVSEGHLLFHFAAMYLSREMFHISNQDFKQFVAMRYPD